MNAKERQTKMMGSVIILSEASGNEHWRDAMCEG